MQATKALLSPIQCSATLANSPSHGLASISSVGPVNAAIPEPFLFMALRPGPLRPTDVATSLRCRIRHKTMSMTDMDLDGTGEKYGVPLAGRCG